MNAQIMVDIKFINALQAKATYFSKIEGTPCIYGYKVLLGFVLLVVSM